MRKRLNRQQRKEILTIYTVHFFILLLISFAVFFMLRASYNVYKKYSFAKLKADRQSARLANLEEEKKEIKSKLDEIKAGFGKEKILREDYAYVAPGEKLIIIKNDYDDNADDVLPEKKDNFVKNFFKKILTWSW